MKDVAQRARDAGIEIFAIGVGRVDMSTLRQMASDPLDDHVDYVESYSVIEKLTKKFQEAFCGKEGWRREGGREGVKKNNSQICGVLPDSAHILRVSFQGRHPLTPASSSLLFCPPGTDSFIRSCTCTRGIRAGTTNPAPHSPPPPSTPLSHAHERVSERAIGREGGCV